MSKTFKPILLAGLATLLYQRLVDGTILFYINRRFVWLIWAAVGTLVLIALSYIFQPRAQKHEHEYEHEHEHEHGHAHALSWLTASLVALPLLLGWLIAPQPLGMAALVNRELSTTPTFEFAPTANAVHQATAEREETILDWVTAFGPHPDLTAFAGQAADVTGFVYRRPDLPPDTWLVSRFLVMCCVADAMPISLVVYAPGAAVADDMWVRVRGHFAAETAGQIPAPLLVADAVTPIEPPAQPYLYYR
jgi:putative membrane protein